MSVRIYILFLCVCLAYHPGDAAVAGCSRQCSPSWIGLIKQFEWMISPTDKTNICNFAKKEKVITPCKPDKTCTGGGRSSRTTFHCCPRSCISVINSCIQQFPKNNMCIPSDVSVWQSDLIALVIG